VFDGWQDSPTTEERELVSHPKRTQVLRLVLLLGFAALTFQLWRLQIIQGRAHRAAAEENSLRLAMLAPLRGVIYDRNMVPLAVNAPSFAVSVTEADLPESDRDRILAETATILGVPPDEIEQTLRNRRRVGARFTPVVVRENVAREQAMRLEERGWALPGVHVLVETIRQYVDSPIFSHVLGYTALPSEDEYATRYRAEGYAMGERVGAAGAERIYEADLRGRPGGRILEVDAAGRPLREVVLRPAEPGHRLILTIDGELQRVAHRILSERIQPGTSGVVVATDPRNGEILAMVSIPGFDANVFSQPDRDADIAALLQDDGLPLFNRAVAGQYPPGSTFKLVTGIGALEENLVNRNTKINCNGGLRLPNPYNPRLSTFLPDWGVMGVLDFVGGLAYSCNVYFYTLGGGFGQIEGLGSERLGRYARMLGYGDTSGVDLPAEAPGRVPTSEWKLQSVGEPWLPGDTYNMAIGQGYVLATPLQVANLTSTLANGGTFYRPHVVRAVLDADGRTLREIAPQATARVALRGETLSAIRDGMIAVLETPQTRAHRLANVVVAGKTGTAEFPGPKDEKGIGPTHGWFTAFAPADAPRISLTVFVERGGGPSDAVPLAMDILREYFARGASPRPNPTPASQVRVP
jgi:penicillin-binding protein 2